MRDCFLFRHDGKYYDCQALPFGWGRSALYFTKLLRPNGGEWARKEGGLALAIHRRLRVISIATWDGSHRGAWRGRRKTFKRPFLEIRYRDPGEQGILNTLTRPRALGYGDRHRADVRIFLSEDCEVPRPGKEAAAVDADERTPGTLAVARALLWGLSIPLARITARALLHPLHELRHNPRGKKVGGEERRLRRSRNVDRRTT